MRIKLPTDDLFLTENAIRVCCGAIRVYPIDFENCVIYNVRNKKLLYFIYKIQGGKKL